MGLPIDTDRRDRLLAALLAEDPTMALLRWDGSAAVLLCTSELRRVIVLSASGDETRERLRAVFSTYVGAAQQGGPPTCFVAVGGGAEVAAALADAVPLVKAGRLAFYHLDAGGRAARLKGDALPLLDRALARVDEGAPLDPRPLAEALARGQRLAKQERAVVARLGGRYAVTAAITAACVALAALAWTWGGGGDGYELALHRMGANHGALVRDGEVYRLFASAFLHKHGVHLAVNMMALWSFGPMLEALLGARRYILLYASSALGGALASAMLRGDRWSVGASGAIWGLMAAGIALAVRPKGLLPPWMAAGLRSRVAALLLVNVLISLTPGVDMLAHLGGGLTGFALTLTLLTEGLVPVEERDASAAAERRPRALVTLGAAIAVVAMAASVAAALIAGRPWSMRG